MVRLQMIFILHYKHVIICHEVISLIWNRVIKLVIKIIIAIIILLS